MTKGITGNQTKDETIKNVGLGALAYAIGTKLGGGVGFVAGLVLQSVTNDVNLKGNYQTNPYYKYPDNTKNTIPYIKK